MALRKRPGRAGWTLLLPLLLLWPCAARAAGFDLSLFGPQGLGRGGAVTAGVADLTAIELNPAALTHLSGTQSLIVGNPLYQQLRYRRAPLYDWSRARSDAPPPAVHYAQIENEKGFVPFSGVFFGVGDDLGLDGWMFAAAIHAPIAVADTRYPEDGPQRYQMVERSVMLINYSIGAARRFGDSFGLGLTLQYVQVPKLHIRMVVDADNQTNLIYPDRSPYDALVTLDGKDLFGMTATAGAWWRPLPSLELALAGRVLPIPVDAEGTLQVEGQGELLAGKGITTGRLDASGKFVPDDASGVSFTYAPSARAGARWMLRDGERTLLDIECDLVWEGWSVMDSYQVRTPPLARVEEMGLEVPLGEMVLPRHWQDTYAVRLGGELSLLGDRLHARAGGFYETGAVPEEYAFLDFVSFDRLGLGAGLSFSFGKAIRLDLSYLHIFSRPLAVSESEGKMYQQRPASLCRAPYTGEQCDPHYPGQPGAVVNAGTYLSGYDLLGFGLGVDWEALLGSKEPDTGTGTGTE